MKILISIWLASSVALIAQNFAVLQSKDDPSSPVGFPLNWPREIQPIGDAVVLPGGLAAPWVVMTTEQVNQLRADNAAAMDLWHQVQGTREERKQQVGAVLQERVTSGQWEPNMLRLLALQSELDGKLIQAFRLNSELLLLVTKAVAGTAATNNLTAPERARVVALRPQLAFAQAPDITAGDRDRVIYITQELGKIWALWETARALRANIETNSAYVDPSASLPAISIGE